MKAGAGAQTLGGNTPHTGGSDRQESNPQSSLRATHTGGCRGTLRRLPVFAVMLLFLVNVESTCKRNLMVRTHGFTDESKNDRIGIVEGHRSCCQTWVKANRGMASSNTHEEGCDLKRKNVIMLIHGKMTKNGRKRPNIPNVQISDDHLKPVFKFSEDDPVSFFDDKAKLTRKGTVFSCGFYPGPGLGPRYSVTVPKYEADGTRARDFKKEPAFHYFDNMEPRRLTLIKGKPPKKNRRRLPSASARYNRRLNQRRRLRSQRYGN